MASILVMMSISLAWGLPTAHAQVSKPFAIIGEGSGPQGLPLPGQPAREHWAFGAASYLGQYFGDGTVQTLSAGAPDPATGVISGTFQSASPFVFAGVGANQLACYYGNTNHGAKSVGTFTLTPVPSLGPGWYIAHWVAEFVPYAPLCKGNFKGVKGSWIMYATSFPFQVGTTDPIYYWWEGKGTLIFRKK
jgi:hypothetical protein